MRTLLVISGGVEAVPGIERAREMGLDVVVADGSPKAPGLALADHSLIVSTYDAEGVAQAATELARRVPIHGVISMAADVPRTVAAVAGALGLPGISAETARLASDKLLMKERLREAGVPIPWFAPVDSPADLLAAVSERGYPLVVKPVDSRGARGVMRITEDVDAAWAYRHAVAQSPTSRVMVEEYVAGPQVSTESVILGADAATPGFVDRNYEHLTTFAPWMIENGGQQPSALDAEDRAAVSETAVRAARALGIERGTAKGDLVMGPEGPVVIEMAARLSGGWMATDQIPLATGIDLVGAAIRLALGEAVDVADVTPRFARGVAIRYFFPPPGHVVRIEGFDEATARPWVHRCSLSLGVGDVVPPVTDHTKRAGFVITTGETREEAVERACRVVDEVRIETEPV